MREILVGVMLLAGSTLMLLAALGLLRFRDALCRAHALAKATTFGVCLMILALWIHLADEVAGLKLSLVLVFSLLTIPLASHLIALLMYREQERAREAENNPDVETADAASREKAEEDS
ncbi:MAG: monovalent cation/H(+) antiporter subunit G [Luteolibacter sp.]